MEDITSLCSVCNAFCCQQSSDSLLPHPVPEGPWQKLRVDSFQFAGMDYLVVADYYSKYPEIPYLNTKTAESVILALKEIFARHGIPEVIHGNNMPFNSCLLKEFAKDWLFTLTTSSPLFPRSNGQAEWTIQIIKSMMNKAKEQGSDIYMSLLQYRNAPLSDLNPSPAQLLSQQLRTKLPSLVSSLIPETGNAKKNLASRQL